MAALTSQNIMRNAVATSAVLLAVALLGSGHFISDAQAASLIPYPSAGTPNADNYTFTATDTGNITAYFAGSDAGHTDTIGLLVNGIPTGIIGLNNHTSNIGDSVVLGSVNAGDTLTFFLIDANTSSTWYSDRSLNTDGNTQHIYSTLYDGVTPPLGVPAGTFIGFEDLALAQGGDFDYNDDSFVFTNVSISVRTSENPLPGAFWLFAGGLGLLGMFYQKKEKPKSAWA